MDPLATAFQNLIEKDVPLGLDNKIRHHLLVIKYRHYFYLLFSLLSVNLIFLVFRLGSYLIRSDALSVIRVMVSDFELSADYLINLFLGLKEIIPPFHIWTLSANLILIISLAIFFRRYKYELLKI